LECIDRGGRCLPDLLLAAPEPQGKRAERKQKRGEAEFSHYDTSL
jgi:hypothetical protein